MKCDRQGILIVISGPSAVGKGTICKEIMKRYDDVEYSVSATTRRTRSGESHGREYFFYSVEEFLKLVENGELLEWAKVYDNYYGTPRAYVEEILAKGKDCILEIDIQGAMQVKEKMPQGLFVFIMPPSREELIRRITSRGTENIEEITKRMSKVDDELAYVRCYDYMVINDDLNKAVDTIRAIITAERCRVDRYIIK